jgi:hypothetical protein
MHSSSKVTNTYNITPVLNYNWSLFPETVFLRPQDVFILIPGKVDNYGFTFSMSFTNYVFTQDVQGVVH